MEQVERRRGRHEQQACVRQDAFDGVVQGEPRIVESVADVMIEFLVLVFGHIRL